MTIHQPSARLFSLIDSVIFLSAGKVTYSGPVTELGSFIDQIYYEAGLGNVPIANKPEVFLELTDTLTANGMIDKILFSKFSYDHSDVAEVVRGDIVNEQSYANGFFTETMILFSRYPDESIQIILTGRLLISLVLYKFSDLCLTSSERRSFS